MLLAQGHGCEDFDGMCCMTLSDHSESIPKKLSQLQNNMKKLTIVENPFDKWLKDLGITGWLKTFLIEGICFLAIVFAVIVILCCILSCLKKSFESILKRVWIVRKENETNIERFLAEQGQNILM